MILKGDLCQLLFHSRKANEKYFWPLLFPTFLLGIWLQLLECLIYGHFFQRKVHYEIRSLALHIPAEKCSFLNISERTHDRVSYTETKGKNIFLSPPSYNPITFSHIALKESIDIYAPKYTFKNNFTSMKSRYILQLMVCCV